MEMILPLREVTKSWSCEASILALALRPTGALPCGESLPPLSLSSFSLQ